MPALTHALDGSIQAGIMLSQLLYWQGKGHRYDGYFFKTVEELRIETGLTKPQQQTAIKILKKYDLIETKLAGIPAKRNFNVKVGNVRDHLTAWLESAPPDMKKVLTQLDGKRPTITKTTTRLRSIPSNSETTINVFPYSKNQSQSNGIIDL
jgi:hypothetical protein